jgi:hypothetical protein
VENNFEVEAVEDENKVLADSLSNQGNLRNARAISAGPNVSYIHTHMKTI